MDACRTCRSSLCVAQPSRRAPAVAPTALPDRRSRSHPRRLVPRRRGPATLDVLLAQYDAMPPARRARRRPRARASTRSPRSATRRSRGCTGTRTSRIGEGRRARAGKPILAAAHARPPRRGSVVREQPVLPHDAVRERERSRSSCASNFILILVERAPGPQGHHRLTAMAGRSTRPPRATARTTSSMGAATIVDLLPGLYAPSPFLAELGKSLAMIKTLDARSGEAPRAGPRVPPDPRERDEDDLERHPRRAAAFPRAVQGQGRGQRGDGCADPRRSRRPTSSSRS